MKRILTGLLIVLLIWSNADAQPRSGSASSLMGKPISTTAPSDNQCLVFVASTGKWTPGSCSAGSGDVTKVGTPSNHQLAYWTGDGTLAGKSITASKPLCTDGSADFAVCAGTEGVWQVALTRPVTGPASPTAGNLTKWDASGQVLADGPKIGTFTDAKWCSFSTAGGIQCTETIPMATTKIGTVTNTKYCLGDGSGNIQCTTDPPAGTGDFKADGSVPMTAAIVPNAANTIALGSTSAEWADLYLGDGAIIYGQNDQSNTLTSAATGWSANLLFTANAGLAVKNGSTGAGFIDIYEDSDDGTNKIRLQSQAMAGDLTYILPSAAIARGSILKGSSTANTLDWLAIGTTGKILTTDGSDPSWSAYTVAAPGAAGAVLYSDGTNWTRAATLSVTLNNAAAQFADKDTATKKMKIDPSGMTAEKTLTLKGSFDQSTTIDFVNTALSADDKTLTFAVPITDNATYTFPAATATLVAEGVATGGIVLGDSSPDADGEIGYASNAFLWYANSEDFKVTASSNMWTFDSNTSAAFTFTPGVTFTGTITANETNGILVGATGVKITSDNDGAITFTGNSAGYDEDLTINLDDTENTAVISSSTGVTKIDFSALNLATTGIITGAVNTNADANGMSSSEMTAAGMYGTMFWATGAGTWNLPGAATGMSFCVYSTTAAAVVINPDDGDTIVLNGTALSAGDSITSASGAGDFICLLAKDANTWYTLGRSGTWTDTN